MVHQTSSRNFLLDHLKLLKLSEIPILIHNTFHHLLFQYRHYISFLGLCKFYKVSPAFLLANGFGPYSNIVFLRLEFFSILSANCICLSDCGVPHFYLLGVFDKYFPVRFKLRLNVCLKRKTLTLACVSVFSLTSQDEDKYDRNKLGKFTSVFGIFSLGYILVL